MCADSTVVGVNMMVPNRAPGAYILHTFVSTGQSTVKIMDEFHPIRRRLMRVGIHTKIFLYYWSLSAPSRENSVR